MDTTLILVIAIFACIAIAGFLVFRVNGIIKISKKGMTFTGSNEKYPSITVRDVEAGRNVQLTDSVGDGIVADRIKAENDVIMTATKDIESTKKN